MPPASLLAPLLFWAELPPPPNKAGAGLFAEPLASPKRLPPDGSALSPPPLSKAVPAEGPETSPPALGSLEERPKRPGADGVVEVLVPNSAPVVVCTPLLEFFCPKREPELVLGVPLPLPPADVKENLGVPPLAVVASEKRLVEAGAEVVGLFDEGLDDPKVNDMAARTGVRSSQEGRGIGVAVKIAVVCRKENSEQRLDRAPSRVARV